MGAAEFRAAIQAAWASIGKESSGRRKSVSGSATPMVGTIEAATLRTGGTSNASTRRPSKEAAVPFDHTSVPNLDEAGEEGSVFDTSEDGSVIPMTEELLLGKSDTHFSEATQGLQRKRYRKRLLARTKGSINLSRSRQCWLDRMNTCKRSLATLDAFAEYGKGSNGTQQLSTTAP